MFVLIIEKRISARVEAKGENPDWYVLLAVALPFKPSVGFEVELKNKTYVKLQRVVYSPNNGTFWAQVVPHLHPRPDAKKVAQDLVDRAGWDVALEASALKEATEALRKKATRELMAMIAKAQSKIVMAGTSIQIDPRTIRGKGGGQ